MGKGSRVEDKDVIRVLTEQEKEKNEVIKEYQRSIRMTIIVCFVALATMYIISSFTMAYQTRQITEAASTIVDTYFGADYDIGTVEQSIRIGE